MRSDDLCKLAGISKHRLNSLTTYNLIEPSGQNEWSEDEVKRVVFLAKLFRLADRIVPKLVSIDEGTELHPFSLMVLQLENLHKLEVEPGVYIVIDPRKAYH